MQRFLGGISMEIKVRRATLNDVKGIVYVHCSGVEEWYKYSENRKADYTDLNITERYLHGGPWMSIETCAIHLNNILLEGNIAIVAEVDGNIVGHAEILISEEPIKGSILKIAHLDVLEVHKDYRNKGIGKTMISFVEDIARTEGCELLSVTPDESSVGFYKKVGIDKVIHTANYVEFNCLSCPDFNVKPEVFDFSWEEIRDLNMIAGRFQSSYDHWFMIFKDRIAGIDDLKFVEAGKLGGSYYVFQKSVSNKSFVNAYLWGDVDDFQLLLGRAKLLGFTNLRTILGYTFMDKLKKFRPRVINSVVILAKEL
jgi:GNAT superfamily N-acetyltransferase